MAGILEEFSKLSGYKHLTKENQKLALFLGEFFSSEITGFAHQLALRDERIQTLEGRVTKLEWHVHGLEDKLQDYEMLDRRDDLILSSKGIPLANP